MLTPNVVCIGVCLKSLLRTTFGIASRLSSITRRMPRLSDSSRRSEISVIFLSSTSSLILTDQPVVAALLDHVGQLGDDDRLLAVAERLGVRARLHADAAAAGLVGVADAGAAEDDAAGREVRAADVRHQALGRRSPGPR